MVFKALKSCYTYGLKSYSELINQQNIRTDLASKFFRGFAPVFIVTYTYINYRWRTPDYDPSILQYYQLEVDKQNTPNFDEQKLARRRKYIRYFEKQ